MLSVLFCWRPRRDLNPCYRRERILIGGNSLTIQATDGSLKAFWIPLAPVIGRQLDASFRLSRELANSEIHVTSKQPPRPLMRPPRRDAAPVRAGNRRPSARKRRFGRCSACRLLGLRASWRYSRHGHHALPASVADRRTGMRCPARQRVLRGRNLCLAKIQSAGKAEWGTGCLSG